MNFVLPVFSFFVYYCFCWDDCWPGGAGFRTGSKFHSMASFAAVKQGMKWMLDEKPALRSGTRIRLVLSPALDGQVQDAGKAIPLTFIARSRQAVGMAA